MSAYDAFERQLFAAACVNEPQGEAPAAAAPAARARPRRRLVPILVGAATIVVFGLVGVATFIGDEGSGGLLSPEEAVAAVQSDLRSGVLHWEATTADGQRRDHWIDLRTGASRIDSTLPPKFRRGMSGRRALAVEWRDDRNNQWQQQPGRQRAGRPIVVLDHPSFMRTPPARVPTPIDDIQRALAAASSGKATVVPAAPVDGVPVVRVSEGLRRILWITREPQPRLVRYDRASWSCDAGVDCSEPSDDYSRDSLTTERWEILPATKRSLAQVDPPTFGTGDYELVDDPQFNRMMKSVQERLQP